jgi:aryl carrier-like protein
MTSWRPAGDDDWNYLRPTPVVAKYLRFEDRGGDHYELVVEKDWPSRVATNRPDGAYATSDLFVKHPTLEAWKYSGRIDDVIVLVKGEKANPLPVEGAVRQDELVTEAVVFGVGKPHCGIFVILSEVAAGLSEEQVVDKLLPIIDSPEALLPDYAKISRDMVLLLPAGTPYPMTDKRTVIRKAFYREFSKQIDEAYLDKVSTMTKSFTEDELRHFLRLETLSILGLDEKTPLTDDDDFFELGMDSLQASRIRSSLLKRVALNGQKLELNVVFDHPSVRSLTNAVYMTSLGSQSPETSIEEQMKGLIEKYGKFDQHIPRPRVAGGQYVVSRGRPSMRTYQY